MYFVRFLYNEQKLCAVLANKPGSDVPRCKITSNKLEMIKSSTNRDW